jgi:hypothetical protein
VKQLALATALFAAVAIPKAHATLQIAFTDGVNVVTCADGQACDLAGPANNIIILNETVGAFHIIGTVAASTFGPPDSLQLSTSLIQNTGDTTGSLRIVVGDTNFLSPVSSIRESASLTFNNAAGSGPSTLSFFADPANAQPGGPGLVTPGTLLFSTSGTPATNPDSFSGTHDSPFGALAPFSMAEAANINLVAGGSLTGFNESMLTAAGGVIPEPSTWVMLGLGFAALGWVGLRRDSRSSFNPLN